ncbi:unnamed protein product [Arctia plantaginis]|uniref:Uncharacterized protein n=1 Tax=Arctia plantaginis TaxID=874455 RepID=A0A8S0ZWN7_ARCPL|nr:unnamed protein product [Arctia plantaginis]
MRPCWFKVGCEDSLWIVGWIVSVSLLASALDTSCDDILCSNINDYVCASVETSDGTDIFMIYQNICYLRRKQCQLRNYVVLNEMPHKYCNIKNEYPARTPMHDRSLARRVSDFSIVGAHQACNHTCPTYCTDDYAPACAQIWERHSEESFSYRPMINHCHIDLFSCASGLSK